MLLKSHKILPLRTLFNKLNNLYRFQLLKSNKHQSGRSMIEMLGVLAVIALLTLIGLSGYTIAMNYYKANETINDVMLRATNVPMMWEDYLEKEDGYVYDFIDLGETNPIGYGVETIAENNENSPYAYRVVVSNVPVAVCKRIISMEPTNIDFIKVGAEAQPNPSGGYAVKTDCEVNKVRGLNKVKTTLNANLANGVTMMKKKELL